jgi:hypothetical protein
MPFRAVLLVRVHIHMCRQAMLVVYFGVRLSVEFPRL